MIQLKREEKLNGLPPSDNNLYKANCIIEIRTTHSNENDSLQTVM